MSFEEETEDKDFEEFISIKRVKSLEQSQQALKNENAELLRERENLTKANTELAEKIKVLNAQNNQLVASLADQSELDLHNKRLASENRDLKSQKRKLEEENIKLKEEIKDVKERHSQLQQQNDELERLNANAERTQHDLKQQ